MIEIELVCSVVGFRLKVLCMAHRVVVYDAVSEPGEGEELWYKIGRLIPATPFSSTVTVLYLHFTEFQFGWDL